MRRRFNRYFSAISEGDGQPIAINIETAIERNREFRSPLWTGENLRVVLMSIPVGGEIGVEIHENEDQFIKIESGRATVVFGSSSNVFDYQRAVDDDFALIIPAGTWHNVINTGRSPLKLFSVYAPVLTKNDE